QPLEDWLQDHAAGETERFLQLPEHVGRPGADGGAQVRAEEEEGHQADADQDAAARRRDAEEDRQVADLLEPEPVDVEGHGLEGQHHRHADPEQQAGPPAQDWSSSISYSSRRRAIQRTAKRSASPAQRRPQFPYLDTPDLRGRWVTGTSVTRRPSIWRSAGRNR